MQLRPHLCASLLVFAALSMASSARGQTISADSNPPLAEREFKGLGLLWLLETVAEPVSSCATRGEAPISFALRLNRRGEVKIVDLSGANERAKACVRLLVQPDARFSADAAGVQTKTITLPEPQTAPEDGIVCEMPLRTVREPGGQCQSHQECGAGQACVRAAEEVQAADGGALPGRCLDFQRWLRANAASTVEKRGK